jgi:hypothetical protein
VFYEELLLLLAKLETVALTSKLAEISRNVLKGFEFRTISILVKSLKYYCKAFLRSSITVGLFPLKTSLRSVEELNREDSGNYNPGKI